MAGRLARLSYRLDQPFEGPQLFPKRHYTFRIDDVNPFLRRYDGSKSEIRSPLQVLFFCFFFFGVLACWLAVDDMGRDRHKERTLRFVA